MAKTATIKKKAIILNHMFTGNYIDNNIGHEIINLFADDNGRNFIYLCKDGKFNRDDIDIENSVVIQVYRPADSKHTLEVISLASGLHLINEDEEFRVSAHSPKYGGKSVYDIFRLNNKQQEKCVTFEAKNIFIPRHKIYITHGGDDSILPLNRSCYTKIDISRNTSQQMREIIPNDNTKKEIENYNKLSQIIPVFLSDPEDTLWILRNPCDYQIDLKAEKVKVTATDIYGIQTRELSYSNAFKYFIDKYPELLREFCRNREMCEINDNIPDEIPIVYREWRNIDLLIDWGNYVIVIENKIFSGINGIKGGESQLDKYVKTLDTKTFETEDNPFYEKQKIFILLTPDHNPINADAKDWREIRFSEIFEFLKLKIEKAPYKEDFHFCDFVESLSYHAADDFNRIVMQKKFVNAIRKIK